jgi:pyruvate/2-oxoglutarate dehydrogenase complex dihydrolipoamide acyltransferase (E2) component
MTVVEVILPKWGLTMEDGTLVTWRKAEGESVKAGEVIAEVETEKITNELESPVNGVIKKLLVAEGTEEIAVGTVLCLIEQA